MDAADFDFLLTEPGSRLLAAAMRYDDRDPLRMSDQLRRVAGGCEPGQVAAAVTQVVLRHRAEAKFGAAAFRMFFTGDGLEQATHATVARHRASRLAAMVQGSCVDLGCGIGSDLAALSRSGLRVTGVERDLVTARVAAANLDALGLAATVELAEAEATTPAAYDVVFADPSRRSGTTRVFDPRAFSPPWEFVAALLRLPASGTARPRQVVVKMAPGLDHALIPTSVEAEWVSVDRELKEVTLWAPAATGVRRRATALSAEGGWVTVNDDDMPADRPFVADAGAFLYEPDPAVIRAHLVAAVAAEVDGWLLDPHLAYISSDADVPTGLARRYRVVESLPFREKALRTELRRRGIGTLTIKKRGVSITPEQLRRRLSLRGDAAATLVVTRTPRSALALLVEPVR